MVIPGHLGPVGRVGALAVFLGVGSLAGWAPEAVADDEGAAARVAEANPATSGPSAKALRRQATTSVTLTGGVGAPASRSTGTRTPIAEVRSDGRVMSSSRASTAGVSRQQVIGVSTAPVSRATARAVSPAGPQTATSPANLMVPRSYAAANPIADFVRVFVGNGTASHPNAGLLVGNGYSWTAETCPAGPCDGGNGGLLGNGGNGFNGGNGGAAGWIGQGGDGGDGSNGDPGGDGGRGGLFVGSGGSGGAGGAATAGGLDGGGGGDGGSVGWLSVLGNGGAGGAGGSGGAGAPGIAYVNPGGTGGAGGSGGAGGEGSWIIGLGGVGGRGGDGGSGGTGGVAAPGGSGGSGGSGGAGGSGRVVVLFSDRAAGGDGGTGGTGGAGGGVDAGAGSSGAVGGGGSGDGAGGTGGPGGSGGTAGGTVRFTPLAEPLVAFVNASRTDTSGTAASLLTPINYNADIFAAAPALMTANYGFDGYMGVPGLNGTTVVDREIAAAFNVAWENVDPALGAPQRSYTSAVSTESVDAAYGVDLLLADTMPLVFSNPLLPTTTNPTDFLVTLSDGSEVVPLTAAFLPNLEFNERQTVVIAGSFGNRLQPGEPGARYPVSVTVVEDSTPLQMLTNTGIVSAVGLSQSSSNPYVIGNGPRLVAAKLNYFSNLGEGGPIGIGLTSENNSGSDLYGDRAQYRLRLYTSAGFSPDGIASLLPSEFSRFFVLEATADDGSPVLITEVNVPVAVGGFGTITVVGLADLAPAGTSENAAYVEDHDNYYDVILAGDPAAIARLTSVRMPSSGGYSPVYNPGGPGNDPTAPGAAPGPFTVPSTDHRVSITNDLDGSQVVTFVEVDGAVQRNPVTGQPIGTLLGLAVEDVLTGQQINAYLDPAGRLFYASFSPQPG